MRDEIHVGVLLRLVIVNSEAIVVELGVYGAILLWRDGSRGNWSYETIESLFDIVED